MGYEIIDECPAELEEPATIIAWITEPDQRDIGVQVIVKDNLGLELIEFSDKTQREYGRISLSREEFNTLLKLIDYGKKKWSLT